jgi:hypothetical protein
VHVYSDESDPAMESSAGPIDGIEAALADLRGLDELEVTDHVARFDAAHAALTDALSTIDEV